MTTIEHAGCNSRYCKTVNELKIIADEINGGAININIPDSFPGAKQFNRNGYHVFDTLRYLIGDFDILNNLVNIQGNDLSSIYSLYKNDKWNILINSHIQLTANFSITLYSGKPIFELKQIEKLSIYRA